MNVKDLNTINEWLVDEQSKEIFNAVAMNQLFGKHEYLKNAMQKVYGYQDNNFFTFIDEQTKEGNGRRVVLFGAAAFGLYIKDILQSYDIIVDCFCDNDENKIGQKSAGLYVRDLNSILQEKKDTIFVIAIIDYWKKTAVKHQLLETGVSSDRIVMALSYFGTQYFDGEFLNHSENEVFIDGGLLDCGTCRQFAQWSAGKYCRILAFEPDEENYKKCIVNVNKFDLQNVEVFNYGLWSTTTELTFYQHGGGGSAITEYGNTTIKTTSIDEILTGDECTFIKMDIEGAELEALHGAVNTIKKYRPKLAISIYHKPEDLIQLPMYIKEICPEYKLYLRHYSTVLYETILYAV